VPQQDDAPAALHPAGELRGAVFLAGVAGRASGFLSGAKIIEVSVFSSREGRCWVERGLPRPCAII
jgi:hypothetical protein